MAELVKVGMADLKTAVGGQSLITYGLGSCVGVAVYDQAAKVAGLAHVMLPDSTQARATDNKAKFADTALPLMVEQMVKLGASRAKMSAKIAGGAQMFAFANATDIMRVGERNVDAVKTVLKELNIRIVAEDVGGNNGRTVEFFVDSGKYKIKTVDQGEKEL